MQKDADRNTYISVIVPCFNESMSICSLLDNLISVLASSKKKCEILIVDDGSTDNTDIVIRKYIGRNKSKLVSLMYLPLTRNFGKEAAVMAGLAKAQAEIIACIDADGQHPPKILKKMIEIISSKPECDMVVGVRSKNNHKKIGFLSKAFYFIQKKIGNKHFIENGTDFRVMRRGVVESFLKFREHSRINRNVFDWMGFNTELLYFEAVDRIAGEPVYTPTKLIKLAVDGLTSSGIGLLMFLLPFGIIVSLGSIGFVIISIINSFTFRIEYMKLSSQGYGMLIILMFFGINFILLGIISVYIKLIVEESQNRPHFIVRESGIIDEDK